MLKGFKDFITRGNVVDLAVGVVIGAAFGAVVTAFTEGILSPLIGLILPGGGSLQQMDFTIGSGADATTFAYGAVISQLITFILTAAAVYFIVVVPTNRMAERRKQAGDVEPTHEEKVEALLEQIARRP